MEELQRPGVTLASISKSFEDTFESFAMACGHVVQWRPKDSLWRFPASTPQQKVFNAMTTGQCACLNFLENIRHIPECCEYRYYFEREAGVFSIAMRSCYRCR